MLNYLGSTSVLAYDLLDELICEYDAVGFLIASVLVMNIHYIEYVYVLGFRQSH